MSVKPKVFIDGREGTTGLQISDRLSNRNDIELLIIDEVKRKDITERKKFLNKADIIFICLPDDAARETVSLIENVKTRVIDASTAHRTSNGWVYGLPELSKTQHELIKTARYVSNPGCHSTGIILLLTPLIETDIISKNEQISITSITGYTGGGRSMINQYEDTNRGKNSELNAPRMYSIGARHKHIPEIMKYTGLTTEPIFMPIVADYPQGMQIIIPLKKFNKRRQIFDILSQKYENCKNITVTDESPAFKTSNINADTDYTTLSVLGFDENILLTAQFDNLGKGASGA
ncbi:MAG: N-acetyl-gamma-glutamyl-phosphate reductase, partial [Oscillospiraceae bacterium]|nr:N-acetyl-gamma-glutamyl-phosphate reductase [Oscillospiraceae bacterium]